MAEGGSAEHERDVAAAIERLRPVLGERLSTVLSVRAHHGQDQSYHPAALPDAVAFARSTEEVAAVVAACAEQRVAVVPYGVGSSIEGQIQAVRGGICIDLSGMDRVLELNAQDLDVRVEAGVTRKALNAHLRDTGLFFPIDPGADASLGGMASTRASGTNAVRYGTMRDNVLGLTVVLASGEVIRTGTRARKSSAGYDLTRLFVGAEGTLGVITEVQLRLYGQPEAISSAICGFPDTASAVEASTAIIQTGIPVARIEFLDDVQMQAAIAYSKLHDLPPLPTLFLEFHGSAAGVAEQAEATGAICRDLGGSAFAWATRAEERNRLWQARHDALYAALALRPGARSLTTDVCVPISRLAEAIALTREDLDRSGILAPIVGHVGDGNFHVLMLIDIEDTAELAVAKAANARLVERALALGGTSTGEHGVGSGKRAFMTAEHGPSLDVMRALKRALDPDGIMNPGKVLPEPTD
ncbi:FAD-binding oxidoreductase [Marinivivus vitaminiproducens]|uniref:FAD-binding oxidoreductase n=1 Tax=Marinivivus vitaminiproducens TaxID=3035935 RepID=UPI00279DB5AE|nr:FAD-linked oxidase C-terminal domain-containing protein [Geminicoccaceae bacterium SCSIO 64248]